MIPPLTHLLIDDTHLDRGRLRLGLGCGPRLGRRLGLRLRLGLGLA